MKILLFHPMSTNTGDRVILVGTENLLREAYGNDVEFVYHEFNDSNPEGKVERLNNVDMLVVSGTPWFWELCHRSNKYSLLMEIISKYSDVKKVGMGLGSCYPIRTDIFTRFIYPNEESIKNKGGDWRYEDLDRVQNRFGKFDLLFTRDLVAQEVLKTAGCESYEVACPASYAWEGVKTARSGLKPLLIFQNPAVGISREVCDKEFTKQFLDFQMYLMKQYNMDVITASPLDSDWLRDVAHLKCEREDDGGIPYSTWIKTVPELLKILENHNPVVSCRVHQAIPSRVMGNLTYILPMDTRFLTATKIGVIPLWAYGYPPELIEFCVFQKDMERINNFTQTLIEKDKIFMIEKLRGLM